jgi:membrane protein insertase Oxa1/YidC/SpoIIIJ
LLVGVSQYFMSKFTQIMQGTAPKKEKKKTEGGMSPEDMQKKMMGGMNYMLPLMTVFFSISYPAALSLYWAVQSFTLVAQYMILDREKTKKGVQSLITKLKKKTSKSSSK